ncbi:aldehyde ferredoxin oxidoreductase family protein [Desulfosporosinus sp. BICA1-9]|uniref:aldehyde ferredoxin oxidoreductase family protein n=1 Tax=Desulfosporosinus sp. BICA1-9 TaxID=1531958 RepID=UPI00054B55FA|nr:aldehyde ferredoxin oxidoreductase C-terminal domain-containing protein [Desulfosporosinus sp. BICA1-9]KJS49949.1 MAG: aldehyde:ferredoxin oxidoreductase [Peptococcaceae bacterium BRH_c23]KJS83477.1 MAG: aldehyde:ferredoxin oxidoreductase [Desulfosporosinus sp. BICA1-9]HBW38274.1 aldehyde:ferredoxin oxidoreductase [Desulfosporosinus sp.]
MDLENNQAGHKLLKEYNYDLGAIDKGYTDRTLYINVGNHEIKEKPVTPLMKDKFIGGKGFGLYYLWQAVTESTKWNDPENEIIISSGPIGGITQYPGSGKSLVVTLSPLTNMPIDSNAGGYFGPFLKFVGFDALELQGKADKDVIIFIDGKKGTITLEEAAPGGNLDTHILGEQLTEKYAENEEDKRNIAVISTGTAAEHTNIGLLNFTFYDVRRKGIRLKQAGRGGIGTVFRDKHIKAVVIKCPGVKGNLNHPVDQLTLNKTGIKLHKEIHDLDNSQNRMRKIGTANIIEVMDQYDLLPTHNYKFGAHKDTFKISSDVFISKVTQNSPDGCWHGCSMACAKAADQFELKTGPYKGQKVTIDGPEYENAAGLGSNCGIFDPDAILELNFYCDTYGIDTISYATLTAFVMECYENGILNKERTGGLELTFGNTEASFELIHQMSKGVGFGKIAGMGIRKMKAFFAKEYGADPQFLFDIGMEQKGLEFSEYLPKESLAQQGGYGLTNKGPQHDEAWLIFMDMVNNQIPTFEDKAEALHYYPMFRTWFGLNGLCKLPWNDIAPADNKLTDEPAKIPEHVQNYVDIYNAVTGNAIDKYELIRQSERVYNFQRIFNIRMGYGKRVHDKLPYRAMGPVTVEEYESRHERYDKQLNELLNYDTTGKSTAEKIKVMRAYRESQYEKLTDAVYKRRGWTMDGVPTVERLRDLGMDLPELLEVVNKHV